MRQVIEIGFPLKVLTVAAELRLDERNGLQSVVYEDGVDAPILGLGQTRGRGCHVFVRELGINPPKAQKVIGAQVSQAPLRFEVVLDLQFKDARSTKTPLIVGR